MFKKLISAVLSIAIFSGTFTAYAIEREPEIILDENSFQNVVNNISISADNLPHISENNVKSTSVTNESVSTYAQRQDEEYTIVSKSPKKNIEFDSNITIPATVYDTEGYVSLNELEPADCIETGTIIDGEMVVLEGTAASARTNVSSMDSSYRLGNMNSKDSFALQNLTGRTNFIGDNLGSEYIDPMTGNLVVTETDLVLPGVDGLDLNLSRYYSLAEAELYTKTAGVESNNNTYVFPEGGGFVVRETKRNTETNETETYNYFYLDETQADRRVEEIETRDTNGGLYVYIPNKIPKNEGDTVYLGYHYTSDITSTSYQQSRNNLGAGWSWSFPSVQVIKDDLTDVTEIADAIYYHDGKGNTMEVKYSQGSGYSFSNYVGKDITFEDYFDYDDDICNTRIDYIVDNPDGTKYYFGIYGELRTIMDRYGNKITFNYIEKDFYGINDSPLISRITDTVGRTIRFEYSDVYYVDGDEYEEITVTVTEPNASSPGLTLNYEKRILDVSDSDGNFISSEPVLMNVTNAIGETTSYYPSWVDGERSLIYPVQFTFADKSFNSDFVGNTSGYEHNMVYLLGNIVRPHSDTYYFYDIQERNLGHSGVCQSYVVKERGDYEQVVDEDFVLLECYDKNVVEYSYSKDYTGYGFYNSIESIPNNTNSYVSRTIIRKTGENISIDFHKINDAILEKEKILTYTNPVGNNLQIAYTNTHFVQKQPSRTKIDYSNGTGYTYTSYVQNELNTAPTKAYGKPLLITKEIDYETVTISDREKHGVCFEYYSDTGFIRNKSWYQNNNSQCFEYYGYNDKQRLSSIRKADGSSERYTYEYNANGKVTKRTTTTDNDSGTTVIEENYTSATGYAYPSTIVKKVTEGENELVETTSYTYDMLLGLVTSVTDNDGNITRYEYDNLGRPTRIIYPEYSTYTAYNTKGMNILPVEVITYDSVLREYGDIVASSDEYLCCQRVTTELCYYITTEQTPDCPTSEELSTLETTYFGEEIAYYMGTGELIQKYVLDEVEGATALVPTTYFYDTNANTVTTVDAQGNETVTYYDGLGREIKTVDVFDNQYITEYNISGDGVGFKAQSYFVPSTDTTAKENIIEYTYDRLQRVTSEKAYSTYPNSFVEKKYTYDFVGNITGITDANGNLNEDGYAESYTYDEINRVITAKNANNEIITNTYDNAGNIKLQKISDGNGNESTLYQRVYDGEGKLISDTDNAENSNTYIYDAMGRLWQSVDKDGKIYNTYYNAYDNIERESYIRVGSGLKDLQYMYTNPFGARQTFELWANYNASTGGYTGSLNEIVTTAYTPSGKLSEYLSDFQYDWTNGSDIYFMPYQRYTYDALGNVSSSLYGCVDDANKTIWGIPTYYEYDKNRIEKVQVDGSEVKNTADSSNACYEFYADGKLKTITFPAFADGTVLKSEYTYDGLSRLTTLTNTKGTAVLSSYSYTYDSNGNILTTNETVEGIDNNVTYTYDAVNRIATVSGTKGADSYYEYDYRGNRKVNFEQTDFLSEESAEFRYNEKDQLYYANVGDDVSYIEYGANGYRYVKQENSNTEFYIYDQNGRLTAIADIAVVDVDGEDKTVMYPIKQYIWGPDRVLAQIDAEVGEIYYYLYNGHGDVVQIVDRNGNIKNRYDYDVWGNFLKKEETIENHFTYFGQTYDEETGLYYLRARYYDPTTGRFTQQDPAEDGYNWYVYGNQNPVMYVDCMGESATAVAIGALLYEAAPYIAAVGAAIVVGTVNFYKEHTSNKRKSTENKHQEGQARRQRDAGGEKGDARRTSRSNKRRKD